MSPFHTGAPIIWFGGARRNLESATQVDSGRSVNCATIRSRFLWANWSDRFARPLAIHRVIPRWGLLTSVLFQTGVRISYEDTTTAARDNRPRGNQDVERLDNE